MSRPGNAEVVQRNKPYPLGDPASLRECEALGVRKDRVWNQGVMALWDGQPRRPPRKGEWYLSGAIVVAYRAPNDLLTAFHIARLCRVQRREITVYLQVPGEPEVAYVDPVLGNPEGW